VELLRLYYVTDDRGQIARALAETNEIIDRSGFEVFRRLVAALRACYDSAADAAEWLKQYAERDALGSDTHPLPSFFIKTVTELTWADLTLARGETETVIIRLEALLTDLLSLKCQGLAVEVQATLASAYAQRNNTERALAVLQPALELAEAEGYVRPFL